MVRQWTSSTLQPLAVLNCTRLAALHAVAAVLAVCEAAASAAAAGGAVDQGKQLFECNVVVRKDVAFRVLRADDVDELSWTTDLTADKAAAVAMQLHPCTRRTYPSSIIPLPSSKSDSIDCTLVVTESHVSIAWNPTRQLHM